MQSAMRRGSQSEPVFMKPAIFIGTFVLVGLLLAFQEWLSIHHMGYHMPPPDLFLNHGDISS